MEPSQDTKQALCEMDAPSSFTERASEEEGGGGGGWSVSLLWLL